MILSRERRRRKQQEKEGKKRQASVKQLLLWAVTGLKHGVTFDTALLYNDLFFVHMLFHSVHVFHPVTLNITVPYFDSRKNANNTNPLTLLSCWWSKLLWPSVAGPERSSTVINSGKVVSIHL